MKILPSNKYTQSSRGCISCRYTEVTTECSCTVSIITVLTTTIELMAVFCKSFFNKSKSWKISLCVCGYFKQKKFYDFSSCLLWFSFFCRPWFQFYKNPDEISMFWRVLRTLQYKVYIILTQWCEVCELSGDIGVLPCCRGVVVYWR